MIRTLIKYGCAAALMMAVVELTSAGTGAQGRRGGPRDWSHRHLVAARSGPDGDRNIGRNWRTYLKHEQIDAARASRDPFQDWLDKFLNRERKPQSGTETPHLDWNLRTGGFGNVVGYPAKYSFDVSASNCSDVIYFTVDQPGSGSAVNVIAITNAYAGCTGNSTGATPTVKFGIAMAAGTATSPVPSLDGKVLYVFESAATGVILHAINVNNITSTPGTYNFDPKKWMSTHTLAAPNGTATSEQLFQITFSRGDEQRVVAVPGLRLESDLLRRLGGAHPPRHQRGSDVGISGHDQLPRLVRHRAAAITDLLERSGRRDER